MNAHGEERELRVEATGETVGEAKWSALRELERRAPGLDKTGVRFEVLSEGERGLLGVGFAPARVAATANARSAPAERAGDTAPVDESPDARRLRELLERISDGLDVRSDVEIDEDAERITASLTGTDVGPLIGKRGQTIDAIETLATAMFARGRPEGRKEIAVDAAGYRARRQTSLEALAIRGAESALRRGEPVELEPMSAVERRIVHTRLHDYPGVETASAGEEPHRFVVISPSTGAEQAIGQS